MRPSHPIPVDGRPANQGPGHSDAGVRLPAAPVSEPGRHGLGHPRTARGASHHLAAGALRGRGPEPEPGVSPAGVLPGVRPGLLRGRAGALRHRAATEEPGLERPARRRRAGPRLRVLLHQRRQALARRPARRARAAAPRLAGPQRRPPPRPPRPGARRVDGPAQRVAEPACRTRRPQRRPRAGGPRRSRRPRPRPRAQAPGHGPLGSGPVPVLPQLRGVLRQRPWHRLQPADRAGRRGPVHRHHHHVAGRHPPPPGGRVAEPRGPQAAVVHRQPPGRLAAGRPLQRLRAGDDAALRAVPGRGRRRPPRPGPRRAGPAGVRRAGAAVGVLRPGARAGRTGPQRHRPDPARRAGLPALPRPAAGLEGDPAQPGADRPAGDRLREPARITRRRRPLDRRRLPRRPAPSRPEHPRANPADPARPVAHRPGAAGGRVGQRPTGGSEAAQRSALGRTVGAGPRRPPPGRGPRDADPQPQPKRLEPGVPVGSQRLRPVPAPLQRAGRRRLRRRARRSAHPRGHRGDHRRGGGSAPPLRAADRRRRRRRRLLPLSDSGRRAALAGRRRNRPPPGSSGHPERPRGRFRAQPVLRRSVPESGPGPGPDGGPRAHRPGVRRRAPAARAGVPQGRAARAVLLAHHGAGRGHRRPERREHAQCPAHPRQLRPAVGPGRAQRPARLGVHLLLGRQQPRSALLRPSRADGGRPGGPAPPRFGQRGPGAGPRPLGVADRERSQPGQLDARRARPRRRLRPPGLHRRRAVGPRRRRHKKPSPPSGRRRVGRDRCGGRAPRMVDRRLAVGHPGRRAPPLRRRHAAVAHPVRRGPPAGPSPVRGGAERVGLSAGQEQGQAVAGRGRAPARNPAVRLGADRPVRLLPVPVPGLRGVPAGLLVPPPAAVGVRAGSPRPPVRPRVSAEAPVLGHQRVRPPGADLPRRRPVRDQPGDPAGAGRGGSRARWRGGRDPGLGQALPGLRVRP